MTVGEDEAHARQLSKVNDLFRLRLRTGRLGQYPTLDEALSYDWSPAERALLDSMPLSSLVGDAASVRRQIDDFAERTGADEVMITTTLPNFTDRARALTGLAREYGLTERADVDARELVTAK